MSFSDEIPWESTKYLRWLVDERRWEKIEDGAPWKALASDKTYFAEIRASALIQWSMRASIGRCVGDLFDEGVVDLVIRHERMATFCGGLPFPLEANEDIWDTELSGGRRMIFAGIVLGNTKGVPDEAMTITKVGAVESLGGSQKYAEWRRDTGTGQISVKIRK